MFNIDGASFWCGILCVCGCIQILSCKDVFISRSDGIYHAEVRENTIINPTRVLKSSTGEIIGLAIDTHDSLLFWFDSGNSGIYRANYDDLTISSSSSIVSYPEMHVTGLAVDWIIKHLYWTDSVHSSVFVSDYSGQHRVLAVTSRLLLPRGLAADPINKVLYIGDQGSHLIMKCTMDGLFSCTHVAEVQSGRITWPNQLYSSTRNIFWTDGWANKVVNCSLDLMNCRETVVNTQNLNNGNTTSLFGMIPTASTVIVSTLNDFVTMSLDGNSSTVHSSSGGNTYYIVSRSRTTQQKDEGNPCISHACSELCFASSDDRYRCSCSSFSTNVMSTNGKNCQPATRAILYAERATGHVGLVSTTLKGHTVIASSPEPRALAYDPLTKMVYYSDSKHQSIYKVGLNGSTPTVFLSKENSIGNVEAMTIDQRQRRLYFINRFDWEIDNTTRSIVRIEMAGLANGERVLIRQTQDTITDIQIIHHSTASYLYYSVGNPNPALYKMSMDGRMENPVTLPGLVNPTQLSSRREVLYVLNNDKLIIWSNDLISEYNLTGQAVSMTSDERYVYFGVGGMRLSKLNRMSGRARAPVPADIDPVDLLYIYTPTPGIAADSGLCDNNDLCKDASVCFKTANPDIVRCKCPANSFNTPIDGSRECIEPTKYIIVSDVDGIKMISLDDELRNTYTIVPNDNGCQPYHGLATDGRRIFFAAYDGQILYTASIKGEDVSVEMVLRNITVVNLAYHDNTLFWTGHYNCFMYNGTVDGMRQCETNNGKLGGVFSLDVTPGSSGQRQVTTLAGDIYDPQGVIADSSYVYWSDPKRVKRMDLKNPAEVPAIVSRRANVFSLQQNKQQTHLFLGGNGIAFRRFATQNFDDALIYSSLSNVRGMSVKGSLIFASDWNSSTIKQYDLRTHQTRLIANLSRPSQIVVFGLDTNVQEKPGQCEKVSSCGVVTNMTCQNDVDCIDGFRSKCCLTKLSNGCRKECTTPVTTSVCNITFSDQPTFTWGYETVTNDKCTTCKCTMDGRSECSQIQCPSLKGCTYIIEESGVCCPVCRDITTCKDKPKFVGCPSKTIEIPLPTTLPDKDSGKPVRVSILDNTELRNITAFSCNLQKITESKKTFSESSLEWRKEIQKVLLVVSDDNGPAVCNISIRVSDTTKPVFSSSSPNDTVITTIAKDENGAVVVWTNPVAFDNSGFVPKIATNRTNDAELPIGIHEIKYIATDKANNVNEIKFYVNVSYIPDLRCSSPPFFHHGSMECNEGDDDVVTCIAKCQRDFLLKSEFEKVHKCAGGKWTPAFKPGFVSACFKPQPTILKISTAVEVDCNGKQTVVDDVVECLKQRLPCDDANIKLCHEDAVSIEYDGSSTIISVQVTGKVSFTSNVQGLSSMNQTLERLASSVETLFSTEELNQFCPSLGCSFERKQGRTYKKTCEKGAVLYHVQGRSICGKCPPGNRFLTSNGNSRCELCGEGKYQEEAGQFDCKVCPKDRPYSKIGTWLPHRCKQKVEPEDSESSLVAIVVGVLVGFVVLIVVLVTILVIVKKRQAKRHADINCHPNPAFEYDAVLADDPNYTSLVTDKSGKDRYASLGKGSSVKYNKNTDGVDVKNDTDNPYNLVGELNPYDSLKQRNSKPENPYDLPPTK
ncbi:low-density lipoprotein receptor-related protein 6-like [Ylistrum balloti]|uniref:low-density lipoprotein receptor-related protein 6-like n=1 Tax=Ylistrum balloti TaxID=509963 RepID=UPI002905B1BA|nr:low-density lipoprotein receptor-related protein 6-like [Ylistrum balloti]